MIDPMPPGLSRRNLLRGTLAAGAALSVLPLAACGDDGAGGSPAGSGTAELPRYRPAQSVKPDLPGTAEGVQDGYLAFPKQLSRSVDGKPLSGGTVTALGVSFLPPPTPQASNKYWQAVNDRIGGSLETTPIPSADYFARFATTTAGNDLPDLVGIPGFQPVPRLPDLLGARFADLSDHLSADKVADYPNLANLPTLGWKNTRFNGRIFGIPIPRPQLFGPLFYRQDLLQGLGLALTQVANADDFLAICKQMTDAAKNRWALAAGSADLSMQAFLPMFRAPNNWRKESDGRLVAAVETEEFAEAIRFMRRLWEAGVYHPDAASMTPAQAKEALASGRVLMHLDGLAAWKAYYDSYRKDNPQMRLAAWVPVGHDGGKASYFQDRGIAGMTVLKQAKPERIAELLRLVNLLCAPFGTEEHLLLHFGLEGTHYTRDGKGTPALTASAAADVSALSLIYLGDGPQVLFDGNHPDLVPDAHGWETKVAPGAVADPTLGLYSETKGKVDATLTKKIQDTVSAVVRGRAPDSALTDLAKSWRQEGGDKIRDEFQQSMG
jgi:putative aldouronate transport system substrate-binding protein